MLRPGAAGWSTVPRPRSGTPIGVPGAPRPPSSPRTIASGSMCSSDLPARRRPRMAPSCRVRGCGGAGGVTDVGRTGAEPERGARNRSPTGSGATSPPAVWCTDAWDVACLSPPVTLCPLRFLPQPLLKPGPHPTTGHLRSCSTSSASPRGYSPRSHSPASPDSFEGRPDASIRPWRCVKRRRFLCSSNVLNSAGSLDSGQMRT
jgi:hypothetical protein